MVSSGPVVERLRQVQEDSRGFRERIKSVWQGLGVRRDVPGAGRTPKRLARHRRDRVLPSITSPPAERSSRDVKGQRCGRWLPQSDTMDHVIAVHPRDRSAYSGELLRERRAGGAPTTARRRSRLWAEAGARRDHRRTPVMDRVHDLSRVDSL